MLLQHALCQPLPKAPAAQDECQTQADPQDPSPLVSKSTLSNAGKLPPPPFQVRTHAPWPGCASIHSYCRQQPGLHPIPRENFRQSQFSVLHAACSGTQSPACGWRDRVTYLQGQGDQTLSTNELFHFWWGQRKPNPRTPCPPSTVMPDRKQAPSVLRAGPLSLLSPCCCSRHPRGQSHPAAAFSLLPQPLHYLSLFTTQMPKHNGLYI